MGTNKPAAARGVDLYKAKHSGTMKYNFLLKQAAFRRMRATRYAHMLFCMLFFTCSFLHAQTSDEGGSFVTRTREGFVIAQVITFPAVPNTVRYEVEIEQELGREYIPAEKIETTQNAEKNCG